MFNLSLYQFSFSIISLIISNIGTKLEKSKLSNPDFFSSTHSAKSIFESAKFGLLSSLGLITLSPDDPSIIDVVSIYAVYSF